MMCKSLKFSFITCAMGLTLASHVEPPSLFMTFLNGNMPEYPMFALNVIFQESLQCVLLHFASNLT